MRVSEQEGSTAVSAYVHVRSSAGTCGPAALYGRQVAPVRARASVWQGRVGLRAWRCCPQWCTRELSRAQRARSCEPCTARRRSPPRAPRCARARCASRRPLRIWSDLILLLLKKIWAENSRESALPKIEKIGKSRGENREESACGALLRALHAPGGPDEARIACGCPASLCPEP
jgi:hypothetical protein